MLRLLLLLMVCQVDCKNIRRRLPMGRYYPVSNHPVSNQEFFPIFSSRKNRCWDCKEYFFFWQNKSDGEIYTCDHGKLFHVKCGAQKAMEEGKYECSICQKPFKIQPTACLECNQPFTVEDPDATELDKTFTCIHAPHFHQRCIETKTNCPTCTRAFQSTEEAPKCMICLEEITEEKPSRSLPFHDICDSHKNIHAACSEGMRTCPQCRIVQN